MRLGVVVLLRVPGKVVHRLALTVLRAHRRILALGLANHGNVAETLLGPGVTVTLWRRGRLVARLHPLSREVLPRTRAVLELRYRGRLRGPMVARAALGALRRTFHLRL
jgi:antitoxin (DNA-binding transcriptional repressor) of toxin-antitoxin stability system